MEIIAVINEKGGVAKTTTVGTLGHALSKIGKRVLLVDVDPQANLTAWIGADAPRTTVANALADRSLMGDAIGASTAGECRLAYGSRSVADAGDDLRASSHSPALALRRALRGLDFDYILIDCPPGLGVLSVNAVAAADSLIIPVNSQGMALSGVAQLETTIDELGEAEVIRDRPTCRLLLTMYDERRVLAREVRDYLKERPATRLLDAKVRMSARLQECYGQRVTIFDYAPDEAVAGDYVAVAQEVSHDFVSAG